MAILRHEKNTSDFLNSTLTLLEKEIILGEVKIFDLPLEVRISSPAIYVAACRAYRERSDAKHYAKTINLLRKDLKHMDSCDKVFAKRLLDELTENIRFCNFSMKAKTLFFNILKRSV